MTELEPIRAADVPPPPRYPFWGYQDLMFLLGLVFPCVVLALVAVRLAAYVLPAAWNTQATMALAAQFLIYGLWFTCLWGLLRVRYGQPFRAALRWTRPSRGLAPYVVLGFVLALGIGVLGALLRAPNIEMPMRTLLSDKASLILVGTFAVTLGPVCEELAFRGFLLPLLTRSLGPATAVILSAAIFSLMHGPQYAWSWQHILLITLAGVLFGVVRLVSGSTAAAAAMHAGYNLTFFVAYLTQWEEFAS